MKGAVHSLLQQGAWRVGVPQRSELTVKPFLNPSISRRAAFSAACNAAAIHRATGDPAR